MKEVEELDKTIELLELQYDELQVKYEEQSVHIKQLQVTRLLSNQHNELQARWISE